jgi:transposase-like protein
MTESAPAADAPLEPLQRPPKVKHRRKRSGTAKWHMSREAVDLSLADLHQLDEQECWQFFVEARFGSKGTIRCPYCGSIGSHYFRRHDRRWKCHGCGKAFTVTTGTIFAQRKLPLRDILVATLTWINSSAGQPALELKRHIDKTYNTAFTLQAKLREALMRAYNVGLLSGEVEMDGADQSGWQSAKKRGEPRGKIKSAAQVEELKAKLRGRAGSMTGVAQQKERDARTSSEDDQFRPFGHRQSENARVLISVRSALAPKGPAPFSLVLP